LLNFQANNHGSLQIICEYYRLQCPSRGSTVIFQPLEHLNPVEFHRPGETVLHIAGSTIDLRSCSTNLEMAEVQLVPLRVRFIWSIVAECGIFSYEFHMVVW